MNTVFVELILEQIEIWMEITIEEKVFNDRSNNPWSDALSDIEMIGVI